MRKHSSTAFCLLVVALPATALHGDILSGTSPFIRPSSTNFSEEANRAAEELEESSYAPFSPGDSDLGVQIILKPQASRTPIMASIATDLHYTDNAPAQAGAQQDESALISTYLTLGINPHIASGWYGELGLSQEFHEFDDGDALDFQNFLAHAGVSKTFTALDDTTFYTRYEYQRITTGSASESAYFAQRIRTGLRKTLFMTPRQQLAADISAAFDIDAGPQALERNEYAAELVYSYLFTHQLSATAIVRSAIWDFDQGGRDDTIHTAGVSLNYAFNKDLVLAAGVYYTSNDSNTAFIGSDSEAWQGGLSLTLNHNF